MKSIRKILTVCLFPLTPWYAVGVWIRNTLFDLGVKKGECTPVPTIGVGNLCTGGTGKTPMTEYLLHLLQGRYATAFLSRGYKRKSKGFHTAEECTNLSPAELLGDEPAMVAEKHRGVQVAVCEKRMTGLWCLLEKGRKPEVVVLDDVFQHRYVRPSLLILLTEFQHPYYQDYILPYGNLRESRRGAVRADIIVVTKCPDHLSDTDRERIIGAIRPQAHQRVFFSTIAYGAPVPLYDATPALSECDSVLLLTGIAHPEPLAEYLGKTYSLRKISYPDHHNFSVDDIEHIMAEYQDLTSNRKAIFTTEKDAARLRLPQMKERLKGLPIYYVPIQVKFLNEAEAFDEMILNTLR